NQLDNMEKNENNIIEEWTNLVTTNNQKFEEPRFRIYQGRQDIYDLILQMCDRASNIIYLVTTLNDLTRLSYMGLEEHFIRSLKRGVKIHVLTDIQKENMSDLESYISVIQVKHLKLPTPIRFLIIDEKETLTTTSMDESMSLRTETDVGLWTNSTNFIVALRIFYESVWDLSIESDARINFLKTGRIPETFRTINDIEEGYRIIREMIKKSVNKLDIMINDLRNVTLSYQDLEEATEKGVKVRLLTHVDEFNIENLELLSKKIDIKENLSEVDLELVYKDEEELLRIYPLQETGRNIIWSNIIQHVETMGILYEDYWERGLNLEESKVIIEKNKIISMLIKIFKDKGKEVFTKINRNDKIKSIEGIEYKFDLMITRIKPSNQILCIEITNEAEAFNKILKFSTIKNELSNAKLILISLKGFRDDEKKLADLYGIQLIQNSNISQISEIILNLK
ncbi:MAG: hypothetical protein JW924_00595, partial [Fusobacteriaceae bacterium]|nr:hypothetical protein [Fusobacteriaceae bacterium]